jgi:fatty-acyl-CoA synthase
MSRNHSPCWPTGLPHDVTLPATNLFFNAEVSAARYPDKPFVIFFGRELTYSQFKEQAEALAGFLQARCAVGAGDRVLLVLQNSPQFIIAYYAILRANAVVVPVNPMCVTKELEYFIRDSGARVAITGQEVHAQISPLMSGAEPLLTHLVVTAYSDYIDAETDLRMPDIVRAARMQMEDRGVTQWQDALQSGHRPGALSMGPDDLCVIPYSSGTTGRPKGCMLTHRNVMHTAIVNTLWFRSHQDSILLVVLPFFHVTSMQGGMNAPVYYGGTIVLMCRWDRDVAADLIRRYRIKLWTAISTMVVDFLANPKLGDYDLSSLQRVTGGGAAMPVAVAERLQELVGAPYVEGYGLTETIAPTHINPIERPKLQCLGIPVLNTESRIIDPQTCAVLATSEIGEIVTRGPQVFKGYWQNPTATAEAFIELDGERWFRTGDLGYVDEEGYFFLIDRLKRMINAAGYKVWPAEVEAELYQHPAIQEACVIASKDEHRGETVKALVVLRAAHKGAVTEHQLIDWARRSMAAYKVPRIIEFVETLPKSATGKINWRALQEAEMARASACANEKG